MGAKHWTEKQIGIMERGWRAGKTDEEIAESLQRARPGATSDQVRNKRAQLRMLVRRPPNENRGTAEIRRPISAPAPREARASSNGHMTVSVNGEGLRFEKSVSRDVGRTILDLVLGEGG